MPSPTPFRSKAAAKGNVRNLPRVVPGALVRVFLLAALAVIACAWAVVHMLTRKHVPMVVPAAPSAVPSEIPAPETAE